MTYMYVASAMTNLAASMTYLGQFVPLLIVVDEILQFTDRLER